MTISRRTFFLSAAAFTVFARATLAEDDWNAVLKKARGQTVYWNAWGGSQQENDFIHWVATTVTERFGVNVQHVKLSDTADAVAKVTAEKSAGRLEGGSVDLIWINGENFAAMKERNLLFGPIDHRLPNYRYVDTEHKTTTTVDFTVPVDGFEVPWGMAQFVFVYDSAKLPNPPKTIPAILDWAKAHPGRFTYPQPPNFLGTTFLKQALVDLIPDASILQKPVDPGSFDSVTRPLWSYLDQLHPLLWHSGHSFPPDGPQQRQLMSDGEIDISLSFSPFEASSAIDDKILPSTTRVYVLGGGTIGNTNFVAIPFNAAAKEGAMVVADFLLSPEAQGRKQDPRYLGDFTVLDLDKLSAADRRYFDEIPPNPATPTIKELGIPLQEPHPTWITSLENEWQKRYVGH